jgi:N-dimethylarginine dimethylaminohydrolase
MQNPSKIMYPSVLMCPPFTLEAGYPNNPWMKKIPPEKRKIDHKKAFKQFMDLYQIVSSLAMVYLLPSNVANHLQDNTYVANLGIIPPHLRENTIILMNTSSPPRKGEDIVGEKFFKMMGYRTIKAPEYFEGEAELKYLRDNIYFGGYGIRTTPQTLQWFSRKFGMRIIPMYQQDPHYYHLDLSLFPLTTEKVITCPEVFSSETIKNVEKFAEIIPIDKELLNYDTACLVRLQRSILCSSELFNLKKTDEHYSAEKRKVQTLTKICANNALEPIFVPLGEMEKSGAGCACMVLHLNMIDYLPNQEPTI